MYHNFGNCEILEFLTEIPTNGNFEIQASQKFRNSDALEIPM